MVVFFKITHQNSLSMAFSKLRISTTRQATFSDSLVVTLIFNWVKLVVCAKLEPIFDRLNDVLRSCDEILKSGSDSPEFPSQ